MKATIYAKDAHLVHARIGPVVVTRVLADHDEASFETYLKALERELGERAKNDRVAVLYYVPGGGTWSATQRTRVNTVLDRFTAKRQITTAIWLLCTPSAATRGVVTAISWISKPPYPYGTAATLSDALTQIGTHFPGFDAAAFEAELAKIR